MPSPRFVFSSLHSGRGPQRHCSSHDLVRLYPEASILFPLQTAPPCNSPLGVSGTPQVFYRTAKESEGTCCPVLRSSLRGALCLGDVEPWEPQVRGTGWGDSSFKWDRGSGRPEMGDLRSWEVLRPL